jgi:hypothetical protein
MRIRGTLLPGALGGVINSYEILHSLAPFSNATRQSLLADIVFSQFCKYLILVVGRKECLDPALYCHVATY